MFSFFPWHISSVFRGLIDFLYYYSVCGVVWGLVIEYIWGKLSHESKYPGSPFSEYFNSISTNSSISSPHLYSASKDWERKKNTYSWTCLFPKLILLQGQSLNRIWSQCKYHRSTYSCGVILFIFTICKEPRHLPSKNVYPQSSGDTTLVYISVDCVSECHNILVYLG